MFPILHILQYTGDWFEIERYPHPDQTGNCGGARYVLEEESNIIRVTNWQVVDGELDAYEGNATFATDGSARITVTMPVPGSDGNYIQYHETTDRENNIIHIH